MGAFAVKELPADRETLAGVYRQFHPRVLNLCWRLMGSKAEAEDASSEVFMKLNKAMRTYDSTMPFAQWLSTVAGHYCVDLLRRRQSERRIFKPADAEQPEPVAPTPSPFEELLMAERRDAVRTAIARLPKRYQTPLVLQYYEELSHEEIARRLGVSRAGVKTLIFRAKAKLRRALSISGLLKRPGDYAGASLCASARS